MPILPAHDCRIVLPDHIEPLIEAVYDEQRLCPSELAEAWQREWTESLADLVRERAEAETAAEQCLFKPPQAEHERLLLPLKLLGNARLLRTLEKALLLTEELRRSMWSTGTEFARVLLLQDTDPKKQPGTEQRKDMQKIVDSLEIERRYWAKLEVEFVRFLGSELLKDDPARDPDLHATALANWQARLRRVARAVFDEVIEREDGSSRALKAAVAAERVFNWQLSKTLDDRAA